MAQPGEGGDLVGKLERATQDRVIALFRDELGYRYLGDSTALAAIVKRLQPKRMTWTTSTRISR